MPHYKLTYHAINKYQKEVWGAYLKFKIHPYSSFGVQAHNAFFVTDIEGEWWLIEAQNELFFKTNQHFNSLEINYQVDVFVPETNPFDREWLVKEEEDKILSSQDWIVDNYRFIHVSPHRVKSYVAANELEFFTWSKELNLLDNIISVRDQLFDLVSFETGVTNTQTTAQEVLKIRKGVCQDFTHLYLAVLRNKGVASRYVSGYLHEGEDIRGASQLHAWAECHIPNVGWVGIDPTNKLLCNHNYIKICHGYDYDDCLPVSGIINTSDKNQTTEYQVKVQQIQ